MHGIDDHYTSKRDNGAPNAAEVCENEKGENLVLEI